LDRLAVFVAVSQSESFTAAARKLGMTKASVSQDINRLEHDLGVTLLVRTTRKMALTQVGEQLLADAAPVLAQLYGALETAGTRQGSLRGVLRVTVGLDYLLPVFGPQLVEFGLRHPDLQIDVLATAAIVDLVAGRVDVGIRRGWLRDSSLIASSLGKFEQYVIASPAYLQGKPRVKAPDDLRKHCCVALTLFAKPLTWTLSGPRGRTVTVDLKAAMTCNDPLGVLGLARAGAGIAVLAAISVEEDLRRGTLVRLLKDWQLPMPGVYAVYPATKHVPAAVRGLVDFLRGRHGVAR
jgi:DNA-binding transcriptional LysR family regulator